jgi:hypothetical protein
MVWVLGRRLARSAWRGLGEISILGEGIRGVSPNPVLLVPLSQIDQEIRQRVDLGREILNDAPDGDLDRGGLTELELLVLKDAIHSQAVESAKEFASWDSYNMKLLRHRFSTDEIASQYDSAWSLSEDSDPYQMVRSLRGTIESQLGKLESLRGRLIVYEPTPKAPRATEPAPATSHTAKGNWAKSRKVWAFTISLATVIGGIAAVLALFIH